MYQDISCPWFFGPVRHHHPSPSYRLITSHGHQPSQSNSTGGIWGVPFPAYLPTKAGLTTENLDAGRLRGMESGNGDWTHHIQVHAVVRVLGMAMFKNKSARNDTNLWIFSFSGVLESEGVVWNGLTMVSFLTSSSWWQDVFLWHFVFGQNSP